MDEPTIYLDVLILINLFVTYFLLCSVQRMLKLPFSAVRIWLASCVGGLCSMVILFPQLPAWMLQSEKLLLALVLTAIAFRVRPLRAFLKNTVCFYAVNFVFAGVMFGVWYLVTPAHMVFRNGSVYFQISALTLAAATILSYLLLQVISRFMDHGVPKEDRVSIKIKWKGNEVLVSALMDTGNHLSDILTGLPVVICELDALKPLFPKDLVPCLKDLSLYHIQNQSLKHCFRLIPLHTVAGQSTTIVFQPEEFEILSGATKGEYSVLVGMVTHSLSQDGSFSALIGPQVLGSPSGGTSSRQPPVPACESR